MNEVSPAGLRDHDASPVASGEDAENASLDQKPAKKRRKKTKNASKTRLQQQIPAPSSHLNLIIDHDGSCVVNNGASELLHAEWDTKPVLCTTYEDNVDAKRFLKEVRAWSLLDHPNGTFIGNTNFRPPLTRSIRIPFIPQVNKMLAYTLLPPVVLSEPCIHTLEDEFSLPDWNPEKGRKQLTSVAHGVAYLHSLGYVHGSLSPSSVMIDSLGAIKLVHCSLVPDKSGLVSASLPYEAPEVPCDGQTPEGDVFSFGIMSYLLFARTAGPFFRHKSQGSNAGYAAVVSALLSNSSRPSCSGMSNSYLSDCGQALQRLPASTTSGHAVSPLQSHYPGMARGSLFADQVPRDCRRT
jgi:serine/threonine protein kinase